MQQAPSLHTFYIGYVTVITPPTDVICNNQIKECKLEHSSNYSSIFRDGYYPHIDGIRAFAILAVLIYHVFPGCCNGGFIGVDLFFVLSGYLITKGLYRDLNEERFSIAQFYVRRIRRILPAYAGAIIFVMAVSMVLYYGFALVPIVRAARASVYFCTNIFFAGNSGYFDAASHQNPMLNMWSLSVEEQFYVFFPLLLAFIYGWRKKQLRVILAGILCISFLSATIAVFTGYATAAFYGLPFRAWELMAGSMLAVRHRIHPRSNPIVGIVALIVICGAFFAYRDHMLFPGLSAALPVICGMLLLDYGNLGPSRYILESKPIVFIGKISYSLYLFHWPVSVFARYLLGVNELSLTAGGVVILLSLILSTLSWRFIEMPLRRTKWKTRSYFMLAGGILLGTFLFTVTLRSVIRHQQENPPCLVEPMWRGTPPSAAAQPDPQWEETHNSGKNSLCALGGDDNPRYLLWGDSHALSIAPGFEAYSKQSGIHGLFVNRRHILLYKGNSYREPRNAEAVDAVLSWLAQHPELRTVFLYSRWVSAASIGHAGGGHVVAYQLEQQPEDLTPLEVFEQGLTDLVVKLREMGREVILFSSVPEQSMDIPLMLHQAKLYRRSPMDFVVDYPAYCQRQKEVSDVFRKLESSGLATVWWVDDFFFPQGEKRPLLTPDNVALYRDGDHLSSTGAKLLVEFFRSKLDAYFRATTAE